MTKIESNIRFWLLVCACMVLIMIGIGGYTRLSGSGLSIVQWQPIAGTLPPLSLQAWVDMFDQYKQFPEFQKVNSGMTLSEFQFIYMVEFIHRLWGRLMGLVLLIPTAYAIYAYRRLLPKISAIWILAGLQGFMGWYMVKSGLVDNPQVSPIRLTAHLILALGILCIILKTAYTLNPEKNDEKNSRMRTPFMLLTGALGLTICFGGLTAGNHGGLIYNTFPDMNGHLLPEEFLSMSPWWQNFLHNPATVQFSHRILAFLSLVFGFYTCIKAAQGEVSGKLKHVSFMIAGALTMQVLLGVSTLVLQVPISLGVIHQVWAAITFSAIFWGYLLCGKDRVLQGVTLAKA